MIDLSDRYASPLSNITWVDVNRLNANDYNPNHVYGPEMKLLELSILKHGWIQPILISGDYQIIDGFHRATLARTSNKIPAFVPCCIMDLNEPERMLLTVRINRAKGQHIALKMHDLLEKLVKDHGYSEEEIGVQIGATKDEVKLLLQDNVFTKLKIRDHIYSKAWIPK